MPNWRIGMAGAGNVSANHLRAWAHRSDCEVVAIFDPNLTRANERAREFSIPSVAQSKEELIRGFELDVLDVATPPPTHAGLLSLALPQGVHVLCQKPIANLSEDIRRIISLEAEGPGRLMVHENWRFRPWFRVLKQKTIDAEFGRIFYAKSCARLAGTVSSPSHPLTPYSLARQPFFADMEKFLLIESVIHQLDVVRMLLGDPLSVYARTHRVSGLIKGEDVATVILGYSNATAVIERSYASLGYEDPPPVSEEFAIEGTAGTAFVMSSGHFRSMRKGDATWKAEDQPPMGDPYLVSYIGAVSHFVECLRSEESFETNLRDNLSTMKLVIASYESASCNRVVDADGLLEIERNWFGGA